MREDGVTFLLASDSPKQFRRFCDRAILLDNGNVVAQTSVQEALGMLRESRRRSSEPEPDDPDSTTDL
jgi:ABC-type multidrug transport system ATPase subunit